MSLASRIDASCTDGAQSFLAPDSPAPHVAHVPQEGCEAEMESAAIVLFQPIEEKDQSLPSLFS